jgi:hypothetical protein
MYIFPSPGNQGAVICSFFAIEGTYQDLSRGKRLGVNNNDRSRCDLVPYLGMQYMSSFMMRMYRDLPAGSSYRIASHANRSRWRRTYEVQIIPHPTRVRPQSAECGHTRPLASSSPQSAAPLSSHSVPCLFFSAGERE